MALQGRGTVAAGRGAAETTCKPARFISEGKFIFGSLPDAIVLSVLRDGASLFG